MFLQIYCGPKFWKTHKIKATSFVTISRQNFGWYIPSNTPPLVSGSDVCSSDSS